MSLIYPIIRFRRKLLSSFFKKKICKLCSVNFGVDVDFNARNVQISGTKNNIEIQNNVMFENCSFLIQGNNNKIIIESNCRFINTSFWIEGDNNLIYIGEYTNITGATQLAACDGCCIEIGKNCLFSHDIYIRTTDSHKIFHLEKRINNSENIKIGNHVWIGMQVLILKGSTINNNCIVGARSMITKRTPIQENVILGGQPAKILKKDIRWKI